MRDRVRIRGLERVRGDRFCAAPNEGEGVRVREARVRG